MIKIFHFMKQVRLSKNRMYFAQVQSQLLILDMNFCYFFIWTPLSNRNVANTLLVCIRGDADFISEID